MCMFWEKRSPIPLNREYLDSAEGTWNWICFLEWVVYPHHYRACPGQYLGQSIIWIELVNLIASFEIIPALDEAGKPIDVGWAKTPIPAYVLWVIPGFLSFFSTFQTYNPFFFQTRHPPAFPCLFKPRSDIVVQRIMETEAWAIYFGSTTLGCLNLSPSFSSDF